jgi:hypothetical protein
MGNDSRPRVLHLRVVAGTGGGPEKTILNSPRFIKEEESTRVSPIYALVEIPSEACCAIERSKLNVLFICSKIADRST